MSKHYVCKVSFMLCGEVHVEADSPEQAAQKALAEEQLLPAYDLCKYVPDSDTCDPDCDVQEYQPTHENQI